jgi:hypothetical protein
MKFITFLKLLYKKFFIKNESDYASYLLAEKLASFFYLKFNVTEYGKIWLKDKDFFDYYIKFMGTNLRSADRKYLLRSLLAMAEDLPGDTAECGVYEGASSVLICQKFTNTTKTHYLFDSFEGLPSPLPRDGNHWAAGDLSVSEEIAKSNLSNYKIKIYKGWIPNRFSEVSDRKFCFVHIDVDLYQPTYDSLNFFYPRLVKGGILLCDDYGFIACPGAQEAFDEYMSDKAEKIVSVPTGQAFIIKK